MYLYIYQIHLPYLQDMFLPYFISVTLPQETVVRFAGDFHRQLVWMAAGFRRSQRGRNFQLLRHLQRRDAFAGARLRAAAVGPRHLVAENPNRSLV